MDAIFEATLTGLERGLQVGAVATFDDLAVCQHDVEVGEALGKEEYADFDFLPVLDGDEIVGVLERAGEHDLGATVMSSMRPRDHQTLISASEPLIDFVRSLRTAPYKLVVRRRRVEGIVTPSDIQKLPVRLLVFSLITHLEAVMAAWIVTEYPDESWLPRLTADRQERVRSKWEALKADRLEIDPVEFTEFCDKRTLLLDSGIASRAGIGKRRAESQFKRIEKLRNSLAHSAKLPEWEGELVKRFVEPLEAAESWIRILDADLPTTSAGSG